MKYQLILEHDEPIADDEFYDLMTKRLRPHWKIVMARSLDGIRPEVVPFLEDDLADIL